MAVLPTLSVLKIRTLLLVEYGLLLYICSYGRGFWGAGHRAVLYVHPLVRSNIMTA